MQVVANKLPTDLVFGAYNGQTCDVVEEFHSRDFGTSLRVRASDGREFTLSPCQYAIDSKVAADFKRSCAAQSKPFIGPGLRRIQRYSARCTT